MLSLETLTDDIISYEHRISQGVLRNSSKLMWSATVLMIVSGRWEQ